MKPDEILDYCLSSLEGTTLVESWGEKGVFYNPNHILKRGVYVLTVKEKDGANDRSSNLNRQGIYRVNLGLRKTTFQNLFGDIPPRPAAGDCLVPHPVYAWMGWISILNPSESTFNECKPLLQEAYEFAIEKFKKRT